MLSRVGQFHDWNLTRRPEEWNEAKAVIGKEAAITCVSQDRECLIIFVAWTLCWRNEMRLKLWLVKKQQSPVLARIGNVWSFLWLGHCSRFIHVQTWLQRGLVFCLDPSWPQSSFVWRWCLWNCLCSTGEHHCLAVSASSWQHHSIADAARPALAVRGSSFLEPYLSSVVPNRFDTRDRFCGRHFSTDRSGGGDMKVQAVMWAMGSGRWSFAHLPAVHLLLCSRGLGTPVLADYVFL